METNTVKAPKPDTGAVLYDLPSPYVPHKFGLLHLPRFIAKIRKHLNEGLPKEYQRNFTKGFDGFLCLHLGVEPEQVIEAVQSSDTEEALDERLRAIFPEDLKVHIWNRSLVQKGMSDVGQEFLQKNKEKMGIGHRDDIISYADLIEFDEDRLD